MILKGVCEIFGYFYYYYLLFIIIFNNSFRLFDSHLSFLGFRKFD